MGCWDDFSNLQRQLLESKVLTYKIEAALQSSMINMNEVSLRAVYLPKK